MKAEKIVTITSDVWTGKQISDFEVQEAIFLFKKENYDRPDELVVSPQSASDFMARLSSTSPFRYTANVKQYAGLLIKVDYDLKPEEWRVRKSDVKHYGIEETK